MPKRFGTLAAAALAVAAATSAWAAPAQADTPGFAVKITQAPDTITVGKRPYTISATASTQRQRRCAAVRWALVISTNGVSLDQVRANRVVNGQAVQVRVQLRNGSAQLIDDQPDQRPLCRNQNVTGRWVIATTGPDNGSLTFAARAFDEQGQELGADQASAQVVTQVAARPTKPRPGAGASSTTGSGGDSQSGSDANGDPSAAAPTPSFSPEPTRGATVRTPGATPVALDRNPGGANVLLVGLVVGGVLVFAGVALLARLRSRSRGGRPAAQGPLPTGFYNMPRRGE